MNKLALSLTLLAALALPALDTTSAQAQNARSWVASAGAGGSDSSACTRTAPCATFAGALAKTNGGGEINCVDQGEFGGGGITGIHQSITIDCEGVRARISGAGANPAVFVSAAATDVVVLRGLDISGIPSQDADGITFQSGAALHVEKCVIHGFGLAPYGRGILFQPTTASSTMELYVSDTVVNDNDSGAGAGILVHPLAANTISKVILNRVEARNNFHGIKADGTAASGGVINMTARDSVASGNSVNGIVGTGNSGGPVILMTVDHCASSHNALGYGVIADGPKTTIHLRHSTASGNNIGIGASNGGSLISYQDNLVNLNSTKGSPTGVASLD